MVEILAQPTDESCGATCLHAVYRYLADPLPLEQVIDEVTHLGSGGTLAAYLGVHALGRGYAARLYSYNLELFDPTWFEAAEPDLVSLLREQIAVKDSPRLRAATDAYLEFLEAGGEVLFEELSPALIRRSVSAGVPVLTGLSATYLYGSARERFEDGVAHADPVGGSPTGHFVLVHGFDPEADTVRVADPYHENPMAEGRSYEVSVTRLMGAILLGVLTYDGNLLVVGPGRRATGDDGRSPGADGS